MLSKKLIRQCGQTNARYSLIQQNDKVLLGLSGGKDSLCLAHLLKRMKDIAPFKFELKCVTISYGMGEDYTSLHKYCEDYGLMHEVVQTNTFELAKEKIRKNSSFCSFFSRMRRGALYTYALENGYNKLAIAHHLDDAVESFFMNFIYNGSLRTLAPKYTAKNGLVVIRPLIHVRERQLREHAIKNELEVIGDEACPAMRFDIKMPHARAETKELLKELEQNQPKLFTSLKSAFENIHLSSFMNEKYLN